MSKNNNSQVSDQSIESQKADSTGSSMAAPITIAAVKVILEVLKIYNNNSSTPDLKKCELKNDELVKVTDTLIERLKENELTIHELKDNVTKLKGAVIEENQKSLDILKYAIIAPASILSLTVLLQQGFSFIKNIGSSKKKESYAQSIEEPKEPNYLSKVVGDNKDDKTQ